MLVTFCKLRHNGRNASVTDSLDDIKCESDSQDLSSELVRALLAGFRLCSLPLFSLSAVTDHTENI